MPLIYYLAKDQGKKKPLLREIQRFFLLAQVAERYGAAAETALSRDFRTLADPVSSRQGLSDLVASVDRDARQYYRGLKIRPTDVKGLASKNVMLLLMYMVMRRRGATEWGPGNTRGLDEVEPGDMHLHHIFPFNFMVANKEGLARFAGDGRSPGEYRKEINDIANLTFLGKERNIGIGDQPPWLYLPLETTPAMRKAHFVPEDPALWKPERFPDFIVERRSLLSKAVTQLLKS